MPQQQKRRCLETTRHKNGAATEYGEASEDENMFQFLLDSGQKRDIVDRTKREGKQRRNQTLKILPVLPFPLLSDFQEQDIDLKYFALELPFLAETTTASRPSLHANNNAQYELNENKGPWMPFFCCPIHSPSVEGPALTLGTSPVSAPLFSPFSGLLPSLTAPNASPKPLNTPIGPVEENVRYAQTRD